MPYLRHENRLNTKLDITILWNICLYLYINIIEKKEKYVFPLNKTYEPFVI